MKTAQFTAEQPGPGKMLPEAKVLSNLRGQIAAIKMRQFEGEEYFEYMPIEKKLQSTLEKLQLAEKDLGAHKQNHGYVSPRARPDSRNDARWKLSPRRWRRRRRRRNDLDGSMLSTSMPSLHISSAGGGSIIEHSSSAHFQRSAPPSRSEPKKKRASSGTPPAVQSCLFGPIGHTSSTYMLTSSHTN